ncbi:MAG: FAD:protein FMN transferase [Clostridia bacterium]|nr:FAD:protein FMN transferase [Clostridia bacterium]
MKKIYLLLIPLMFIFVSCSKEYTTHTFFAMDTFITVDAKGADSDTLKQLESLVYEDEKKYSRTFSGSELYIFNKTCDDNILGKDTTALILESLKLHKDTDGNFSPFLGALTELWDIKNENPEVPGKSEILSVLQNCNPSDITIINGKISKKNPLLLLDLGGIAKGKSSQNCIEFLKSRGISDAVISFGGSIACIGKSEKNNDGWKIGIKNPFDTSDITGSVTVTDCYIAVSGAYERNFEKDGTVYHHILDPKTGYPAESDIESVAVISDYGAVADGMSTALFVMGKEKALEFYKSSEYDFEAIIITKHGEVVATDGIRHCFDFKKDAKYKDGQNLVYNK